MLDRRHFLRLAGATAVALAGTDCTRGSDYDSTSMARPALLDALSAPAVRAIGNRYRALNRDEAESKTLQSAIRGARPLTTRLFGAPPASLESLVKADFENGRTIVIDGWVLSLTEARQCALYSLLPA